MNRDVKIAVAGTQDCGGENEIVTEYKTEGQYFERGDCRYLLYREQDGDSGAITENTLKIKGDVLELSRKGNIDSHMIFETGQTHHTSYVTAYGTLKLEVYTEDLKCLWAESEARVQITYRLFMTGELLSRNRLVIKIRNFLAKN